MKIKLRSKISIPRCTICHDEDISVRLILCCKCGATFHTECGSCPTIGCNQAGAVRYRGAACNPAPLVKKRICAYCPRDVNPTMSPEVVICDFCGFKFLAIILLAILSIFGVIYLVGWLGED
jgi:hypothetical protein